MRIAIVNYGMGNLHSVFTSVQAANHQSGVNASVVLTADPDEIFRADKIIFPGQGAMPDCMTALRSSALAEVIVDGLKNKPFFGICVGAQLLFDHSEEGNTKGLAWFPGQVKRFIPPPVTNGSGRLKVPHMGWNTVHQTRTHPLFAGVPQDTWFYFVHSYYFVPQSADMVLATSAYPDDFACVVGCGNVFATQFHTEKSHKAGLQLLQNFIRWDGVA